MAHPGSWSGSGSARGKRNPIWLGGVQPEAGLEGPVDRRTSWLVRISGGGLVVGVALAGGGARASGFRPSLQRSTPSLWASSKIEGFIVEADSLVSSGLGVLGWRSTGSRASGRGLGFGYYKTRGGNLSRSSPCRGGPRAAPFDVRRRTRVPGAEGPALLVEAGLGLYAGEARRLGGMLPGGFDRRWTAPRAMGPYLGVVSASGRVSESGLRAGVEYTMSNFSVEHRTKSTVKFLHVGGSFGGCERRRTLEIRRVHCRAQD